jgi:site-specific DNA recombinase
MEIKKKAIIYARVSSKEQEKEGFSIPAQISFLKDYAAKNGIRVVKIFKEAETAKKAGRKQFQKMLEYIEEHKDIKMILVEKTDRLYRNIKDWTKIDYEALDLEIHLAKEGDVLSKSSNSNQKFMHGIKVLMAKNYVDNLSEEVKKGHAEKLKRGIWPGKAPIGYRNRLEDHTIQIDEQTAPIIKKAFEMAKTGNYSLSKLKRELYNLGIRGPRSGKELAKSQMARVLSNPFYYGEFVRAGKMYKGSHTPIISKELFDSVQLVLGFVKKPGATKYDFAFRGPLKCNSCGCQITAEIKKKPSGRKYTYYHCTNGKGNCDNVTWIREEKIEEQYVEALRKISLPLDIVEFTKEALLSSHRDEKELRELTISKLTARYKKLDSYIDKLYTDKIEGIIELSYWERRTSEYKNEQEDISVQINALRESNTEYMLEGIKLMEVANSAATLFSSMDKDEKRELLNLVLSNPKLENANIRYSYKKPFDLFVNVTDIEKWRERRDSNPRPSA